MQRTNKQPKRIRNNSKCNVNTAKSIIKEGKKESSPSFLKVYQIDGLDKAKAIQKLKVTISALEKVKDSLEIQLQAEQKSTLRIRKNSLFIQNTFKSFNQFAPEEKQDTLSEPKPKRVQKTITIFQAIDKSKQRCQVSFIEKRLKQQRSELQSVWRMLRKVKRYKNPFQSQLSLDDMNTFGAKKRQPQRGKQSYFLQLEKTVGLFDKRFQLHNKDSMNIFKLSFEKDPVCFYNYKQVLSQHKFYSDSVVHSQIKQIFIQPFNDFSSYQRSKCLNSYSNIPEHKLMLSFQVSIKLQQIGFDELMMISKGNLTSDILRQYLEALSEIQEEEDRLLQNQPQGVKPSPKIQYEIDNKNIRHKQCFIDDPINFNWKMKEYQLKYQSQIEQIIKKERAVFQNNIQDKTTAQNFQKNKQTILQSFITKTNSNHSKEKNHSPLIKRKKDGFSTGRNMALINVVKKYKQIEDIGKKKESSVQKSCTPERRINSQVTPQRKDKLSSQRTSRIEKSSTPRKEKSTEKIQTKEKRPKLKGKRFQKIFYD